MARIKLRPRLEIRTGGIGGVTTLSRLGVTTLELLLLLGIPALVVWGIVFVRFAGIAGCLVAVLLAGTVVGHPFFHISAITFDRLILGGCIALFLGFQIRGWNQPRKWVAADLLFGFFIFAMILTTVVHRSADDAVGPYSKLIFFFLLPAIMYVIGGQVTLSGNQLKALYCAFAALGVYLALTAVAEKLSLQWAIFPKYIADPAYEEFLGRGRGPLLNPAANGILMTLALVCGLMPVLWCSGIQRVAVIATIPIYLVGIACTMTRSVWLGCLAVIVGIAVVIIPRRWRLPMAMTVLGLASMAWLFDAQSMLSSFKRDRNVSVEQMRESASLRPILAMVAWKMFQDHPLLGCGTDQYLSKSKAYLSDRNTKLPLEKARPYVQHNMFLAMLVENGLIAVIPFCLLMGIWSFWSWKLWREQSLSLEYRQLGVASLSLLISYAINGMFHDVLIFPMINMYLFFMAGMTRNCATHLVPGPKSQTSSTADRRRVFRPSIYSNSCGAAGTSA